MAGDIADFIPFVTCVGEGVKGLHIAKLAEKADEVSNTKLKNCINEMYRQGAEIGDGGLADAIRHELTTGELVGGKSHIQKGIERVKNLENIIAKQKSALELGGF